jgi:enolase-phosphatase E1
VTGAPRVVLLDIEGTTTPVDFVTRVLFPYAHAHVLGFLSAHAADPEVAADVKGLHEEHARDTKAGRNPPAWGDSPAAVATYARWLIEADRKATPLKSLQGKIWALGYQAGELKGPVYEDVTRALRRWTEAGRRVAIFSSGSTLAQKLIFGHSDQGDLTPYLSAYFDTTTGPKGEAESYQRVASSLQVAPAEILFVSDTFTELEAAREAGLATTMAVRSDTMPTIRTHRTVFTFDAIP